MRATSPHPPAQTTDAGAECQCFNRAVDYGQSEQVSVTDRSLWKHLSQPTATTPILPESTGWAPLFSGTQDPTDGQQKMAVTDSRVTSGVGKENDQTDGVVSPSATSTLLRAVHTDSSLLPGRSSEASVKMGAFPTVMGTPPFSTESHTTSVFPDAPVSTDDTPFPDTGVTDLFVGPTDSGGEDNLSRTTTAFSRGPKQSKGFTTDSLTDYVSFGPHVTAISSQVNAGRPATPAPLQEVQVERTHKMAEASAIVPLAKRSVDPRLDGSHLDPLADSPSPQRGTTTKSQLLPAMEAPIGTISNRSPNLQHRTPSSEITDEKVVSPADPQDPRKHFQSGGPGTSHDSHTAAFVMAPVCGGLLLLPALYWLRRQKKLQDLLQRSQMTENQRLNPQSTDLEMQDGETMVQACMPSPYSGQL
ncbi:hypothetical protein AAFF_G00254630 [Aldrovandia affinis]|uniref:Uncharacterized protein n=1 Tax=Aldrovandia affinis TaxID=143900 RepID=A0AAD7RCE9_9TELE|nr:hypothetical protein AAFF_G00254630 [Aldrovandia affinis]